MDPPPVQYVTTSDGYNIAYAVSGDGLPFIYMPNHFSHINIYWTAETYLKPWFTGLAERFRFVQYDGRGQGMSTRGIRGPQSIADLNRDLEAVIDRVELARFVLMAMWDTCHAAVHYTLEHPERVAALILWSTSVDLRSRPPSQWESLPGQNWDAFILGQRPLDFTREQSLASLNRIKQTVTQSDYLIRVQAFSGSDLTETLGGLRVPTLVLHPRDLNVLPADEAIGLAAAIPDARIVFVEGDVLPGRADSGLRAIDAFLGELRGDAEPPVASADGVDARGLSVRELEVLRLMAVGLSNQQIADELVISLNTVRRHVSNIYVKTGAGNRATATNFARDHGLT